MRNGLFRKLTLKLEKTGIINYRVSPTSTDSREVAAGPPRGAGGGSRQSPARIAEESGEPDQGTESFHGARWRVLSK